MLLQRKVPLFVRRGLNTTSAILERLTKLVGSRVSVVLRDQRAFAGAVAVVLAAKLVLAALVPASADLGSMLLQGQSLGGPWILGIDRIVSFWESVTGLDPNSWVSSPPSFSAGMMFLGALVRLPTLVFDIGVAGSLYFVAKQIGASTRVARLTCLAWLLNPYATFAVEMIGTPDIAASFMTVIMALFLLRKKLVYAGLALAVGTALKLYPILLLPMALAYSEQSKATLRARAFFVVASLLGLFAYFDWLFQGNPANTRLLLEYTPITQPITNLLAVGTGVGVAVTVLPVVLVVTYYITWILAKNRNVPIVESILPLLLVYYAFSSLYPQYLVWALPFLTLDAVVHRRHIGLLALVLTLMFGWSFLYSGGYLNYSGYSLLFFPLQGPHLPWYSQMLSAFLASPTMPVFIPPFLKAGLSAATLVYALTFFRNWVKSPAPR